MHAVDHLKISLCETIAEMWPEMILQVDIMENFRKRLQKWY